MTRSEFDAVLPFARSHKKCLRPPEFVLRPQGIINSPAKFAGAFFAWPCFFFTKFLYRLSPSPKLSETREKDPNLVAATPRGIVFKTPNAFLLHPPFRLLWLSFFHGLFFFHSFFLSFFLPLFVFLFKILVDSSFNHSHTRSSGPFFLH